MSELQGVRLPDVVFGEKSIGWDRYMEREPGVYMRVDYRGRIEWWIVDPFRHVGRLTTHRVEEHDDGSITVTPSILDVADTEAFKAAGGAAIIDPNPDQGWHGWLEHGVWRS